MPRSQGLIRPSAVTADASVRISPAPPTARLPRCTRCQSFARPSRLEYSHICETVIRLRSVTSRRRSGLSSREGKRPYYHPRVLIATTTLAARLERAEADTACAFARSAAAGGADVLEHPIGGTVAVYGGPGQPFNKVAGLGFAPVDESD